MEAKLTGEITYSALQKNQPAVMKTTKHSIKGRDLSVVYPSTTGIFGGDK